MRATPPSLLWFADGAAAIAMAAALACAAHFGISAFDRPGFLASLAGLIIATILRASVQLAATGSGQKAAVTAKHGWRRRAFAAVLTAPAGSRTMLGEQVADATDRIEDLDGYHARFLPLRFAAVATPLLIAAAAAAASWVASAILLGTLLPFALGMILAGTAASRVAARQLDILGRLSGLFIDRVRALPIIIGFGAQERIGRHLAGATQEVATRTLAVLRIAFLSSAVLEFFAALSVALVAVYCGFNLLGLLPFPAPERLDLGRALFVLVLAPEFYLPMRRLAAAYHDKQVGEAAMQRLAALPSPLPEPSPALAPLLRPPAIRIEGLTVDYGERHVGPFTMDIPAGRMTVVSGPTGSGKSSLLNALMGLAPATAGDIQIDSMSLAMRSLGGQASWTGQSIALLPGTIFDNIRLARPGASDADVADAARRAGLLAFIAGRKEGLGTRVDTRGSGLSGGERRRIGIARALLRDAPLWLLDEPTADLDRQSVDLIMHEIRKASAGRTVLIVTHDPGIAAMADQHVSLA
ncbi:thiol reductant ABC exporter subunit CydD [Sphingobium nicotianae]|uniref:Thiol reductant ABC exporter subunit CydD n=1 Tax=Sphingobium nicotianae TaxID=2782607 RepID=A0A9X1ITB6_9SPHN|nr:thiol reductant ABC exporter subunit CydD [Sphingobium nicotianae]MBT2189059.1 thiol reductant ABC exporter subunit CydD [Sphingobium nicotianae]